nr:hypothetical protein [Caballeronia sp. GAWG2-1]
MQGLKAEAMYAFSNDTDFANNHMYSAATQYTIGSLTAAVAYLKINNPRSANGAVSTDGVFAGSSQQDIKAGFAYALGATNVEFAYSSVDVCNPV